MIRKERIKDEVYVYYNGQLLYKRWINYGYGRMFYKWGYNRVFRKNET